MAEVKWIKITTSMFEDEKIDYIESLPEADAIQLIWIRLLTMAGKCNNNGYIYLTEKIPYNAELLAHKLKRPLNTVRLALQVLQNLEMIEFMDNGFIFIVNWAKHQNLEGLEKIREQNRLRKQKQRQNERILLPETTQNEGMSRDMSCDSHNDVTPSHAIEEEREIEIEIEIEEEEDKRSVTESISSSSSDPIKELFNLLKDFDFKKIKTSETIISLSSWVSQIGFNEVKLSIIDAKNRDRTDSLGYLQSIINRKIEDKKGSKQSKSSNKYENFYL